MRHIVQFHIRTFLMFFMCAVMKQITDDDDNNRDCNTWVDSEAILSTVIVNAAMLEVYYVAAV